MFIANVSLETIEEDNDLNISNDTILISITDIGYSAKIKNTQQWKEIYRFQFEDIEEEEVTAVFNKGDKIPNWATVITDDQAKQIAKILLKSIKKNNIVVHCSAGVSRSGAVTEVGLFLGYELYNFSNLRTINKTVCIKIKKYIPIYKIIPATIKVWIAKIFNKQ